MNRLTAMFAMGVCAPALLRVPARAQATSTPAQVGILQQALVLSGGGALGAYEAGIIQALVGQAGARESEPLRPYELVCGASIGALNGYLVATAQYAKLQSLWSTVASSKVVRYKYAYGAIHDTYSGIFTRLVPRI